MPPSTPICSQDLYPGKSLLEFTPKELLTMFGAHGLQLECRFYEQRVQDGTSQSSLWPQLYDLMQQALALSTSPSL